MCVSVLSTHWCFRSNPALELANKMVPDLTTAHVVPESGKISVKRVVIQWTMTGALTGCHACVNPDLMDGWIVGGVVCAYPHHNAPSLPVETARTRYTPTPTPTPTDTDESLSHCLSVSLCGQTSIRVKTTSSLWFPSCEKGRPTATCSATKTTTKAPHTHHRQQHQRHTRRHHHHRRRAMRPSVSTSRTCRG